MSSKILCVIFGASGMQGGSVIRSILASPQALERIRIRGVCRDLNKPAARYLESLGVEVVAGNLSSESDMRRILTGASLVYLVTAYSGNSSNKEIEIEQGQNVARLSKELGIEHLIFSTLLHVKEITSGKIQQAQEFDSKAEVEKFIRQLGIPATFIIPGFYMSLFVPGKLLVRSKQDPGILELVLPVSTNSTKFPLVDMNKDFGNFVVAALLNRDLFLGKQVYAAEAYYTLDEIAAVVNRFEPIHGFKCVTREINDREFLDQGSIAGKDAYIRQVEDLDMYRFMREPGYYLDEDLNQNQGIVIEPLSSFEEFVKNSSLFSNSPNRAYN
ncbi:hypothetical protein FOXG_04764 [Fusarium oxysporum f. sp. lycopersici 4287]|uniref:NmrA-like domain-containing protein n=1 Tax=Fusarium oxysporum f. sp. lycopersici (strain 4287 / CBS 123668 / FGSC 9935 / NRRL 34936) TaxID=426428 RepID=A0A0J9UPU6_FUSO4|nr:hypothetical protein FOXG_04764 [Fusarium oxysporum f. sp. lycopersici 4287]KAJ9421369.1 NmrA-like family-domain-containing protein [Fusarium oxysporum]KNB01544.1 hypothetical protein FOXG_04764 [Fusarium oxysporum f. sp. lycopersici 4287]